MVITYVQISKIIIFDKKGHECAKSKKIGWSFSIQFIGRVLDVSSVSLVVSLGQKGFIGTLGFEIRHVGLFLLDQSVRCALDVVSLCVGWAQRRSVEVASGSVQSWRGNGRLHLTVQGIAFLGHDRPRVQDIYSLGWKVCGVLSEHVGLDRSLVIVISSCLHLSVVGCHQLALLRFFHLLSLHVVGFRNVRATLVAEKHRAGGRRLRDLLIVVVDSLGLICNICCLVIKSLFHHSSQGRKTELGGDLGVEVLRGLDLPVGHQAVTLLVDSICYNASCLDEALNVMM